MAIKRELFERYFLEKNVEVTIFDGQTFKGFLRKTRDEKFKNDPNLFLPQNLYFVTKSEHSTKCISCLFRVSHVKKVSLIMQQRVNQQN